MGSFKPYMKRTTIFLSICFIVGILFRLWFISLAPQEFKFDQVEYEKFALGIVHHGVYGSTARLYGYPMIVAFIYSVFGIHNLQAVYIVQAVFDSLTAIFLYIIAKRVMKKESVAWIAFLLYLFNPFTSAYVGVLLSEVTGIFFTTLLLLTVTITWKRKESFFVYLVPFIAGLLSQIRPAFMYFAVGVTLLTLYRHNKPNQSLYRSIKTLAIYIGIFLIPFLYTLLGNIKYFHEWKLTNVDHIPPRELYISVMIPGRSPVLVQNGWDVYPQEVMYLYGEYSTLPTNKYERDQMAKKYLEKAKIIIANNPLLFIKQRFEKMFYVWEKHTLFYYNDTNTLFSSRIVYWGNLLLLFLGGIGTVLWWIASLKQKQYVLPGIYTLFLLYISLIHSVSFAEERYSLPGYPMLYLFAGYTIQSIWDTISKSHYFEKGKLLKLLFG